MPGATIDHLVAFTIFLAALLLFTTLFTQNLQTAILYQRSQQVDTEASTLLDSISLNTGYQANWGATNSTPTSFGLQDPVEGGYTISAFSLMRLSSSTGTSVFYPGTGLWYSNVTMAPGGFMFAPFNRVVNYTTATKLLGVNGSYGFQLTIVPTLNVSMTELTANPLQIRVTVKGPGLPLANAYLTCDLIYAKNSPSFQMLTKTARTYADGSAILNFSINASQYAYALIVNANLGGLYGVGYLEQSNIGNNKIIPMVQSFNDGDGTGRILLAHSYDLHNFLNPEPLNFTATFLVLGTNVLLQPVLIGNGTATGQVNPGHNQYSEVRIPNTNPGVLVVTYSNGSQSGISLLPWGIGSLGVRLVYGNNPPSNDWVATDVRQVMVAGESYQIKIALWSLAGIQIQGPGESIGT